MPVISITMGPTIVEQKQLLVERLTAEAVSITRIPAEHFTVLINELSPDNIGCGGKTQKALRAAK